MVVRVAGTLDFEQRQTDKQTQTDTEADYVEIIGRFGGSSMIGSSGFCMTLGQEFRNCLNHQHHCLSLKCSSVLLKASELDAVSALFLTSGCWHETGLWLRNEYPQLQKLNIEKRLEYVTRIVVTCSNHAKICDHAADSTFSNRPPPTCLLL